MKKIFGESKIIIKNFKNLLKRLNNMLFFRSFWKVGAGANYSPCQPT